MLGIHASSLTNASNYAVECTNTFAGNVLRLSVCKVLGHLGHRFLNFLQYLMYGRQIITSHCICTNFYVQ